MILLRSKAYSRLLLVSVATLLLSGCSTQVSNLYSNLFGEAPPDIVNRLDISELWDTQISSSFSDSYLRLRPLIRDKRIYACGNDGGVAALNIENGRPFWRKELDLAITAGVGGGDKAIVVGGRHGEVLAFTPKSGKLRWKQKFNDRITAVSESYQGVVIVRTLQAVIAVREESGDLVWRRQLTPPSLTIAGSSVPLFYKGAAFVGLDSGDLWVMSLEDGSVLRTIKLGIDAGETSLDRIVDIDGQMSITDGVLYAAAYQGRSVAIDLNEGRLLWTQDISSQSGLTADKRTAFIVNNLNQVVAVERSSGKQLWVNEYPWQSVLGAPNKLNIFIVLGDAKGSLFWLSRKSGHIYHKSDLGNDGITGVRTQGRNAYVLGNDGALVALRLNGYLE